MVIMHNSKTEIVNNLKDCFLLAEKDNNEELLKATEYFIKNGDTVTLQQSFDDLQTEFKCYEASLECRENCLNEVKSITEEVNNRIINSKRLNRNEILQYLKSVITCIENEY